jgi:hypothetical protein
MRELLRRALYSRAVWIRPWIEAVCQDGAYAARTMRRQPLFAAVIVVVLGTVIGLHSTLATVLAGAVLRPWPGIADPSRVVAIYMTAANARAAGFSLADTKMIARHTTSLTGVAASTGEDVRAPAGSDAGTGEADDVCGDFAGLSERTPDSNRLGPRFRSSRRPPSRDGRQRSAGSIGRTRLPSERP